MLPQRPLCSSGAIVKFPLLAAIAKKREPIPADSPSSAVRPVCLLFSMLWRKPLINSGSLPCCFATSQIAWIFGQASIWWQWYLPLRKRNCPLSLPTMGIYVTTLNNFLKIIFHANFSIVFKRHLGLHEESSPWYLLPVSTSNSLWCRNCSSHEAHLEQLH